MIIIITIRIMIISVHTMLVLIEDGCDNTGEVEWWARKRQRSQLLLMPGCSRAGGTELTAADLNLWPITV